MTSMIAAMQGLHYLVIWPNIGYLILGVVGGSFFGMVPGLNGIMAVALFFPFIWGMDVVPAIAALIPLVGAVHTANTFPAVFFNIPGSPSAAATILDGYPLGQKGEGVRALSAAFMASVLGGVLSAFVLGVSMPLLRPFVLLFATPERFMLIVWGVIMISTLSMGSKTKGLIAALFGFLVSMIGIPPQSGDLRFTFGLIYFISGVPLIPLTMGLFGIPELIAFMGKEQIAQSHTDLNNAYRNQLRQGIKDVFSNLSTVLRGSLIGVIVGAIPGLGGTAAAFYSYTYEAKNRPSFGKGDILGVIAPESANNASQGGEMIPTLSFGVPGSAPAAVLLAALMVVGFRPGPTALTSQLPVTFTIVWAIVLANIGAAGLCFLFLRPLVTMIQKASSIILAPVILLFIILGSLSTTGSYLDLYVALIFGLVGYLMMKNGWPRAPLFVAYVLGTMAEKYFFLSYQSYRWMFITRPISFAILLIILATSVIPVLWRLYKSIARDD